MLGRTLTFNKQELQKRFTNEHIFYLVAETEADMNRNAPSPVWIPEHWVRPIAVDKGPDSRNLLGIGKGTADSNACGSACPSLADDDNNKLDHQRDGLSIVLPDPAN
ncbi:GRB2-associated-binding protein 2 [Cricetulus griseus]|uniref:GRB2-associated-binding protein 2 n=1 Tax=Cricetulus griseus TaxID=10029 RepID=A0A061IG90_CRIGR|nr:GRB2-associated-binding protein 2 [Cricetulus griseus]